MGARAWGDSLSLPGLIVDHTAVVDGVVRMSGRMAASQATCPDCGTASASCHSRYDRTLSDLPVSWAKVDPGLSVRRLRCVHESWSRDTMLRVLRRGDPMAEPPPPARVIGIDDFAWRRGHSYGSIVVDLERHQVIDLLPDRQRETVIAWLRENPQVEIICRELAVASSSLAG